MSVNNLLLGLGDNKDKNYTYIVKGISTDVRELVKVVNATGIATTIYTYPANYVCLYTLQDNDYIYSVMRNSVTTSLHYIYKTHKTTYVTTNSASISINGVYNTLEIPASGFVGDYITLGFYNTLYTVKIHKTTLAVSYFYTNAFSQGIKCLLPNGTYMYRFTPNNDGMCTWYKYDTSNFGIHSTGTFSGFTPTYDGYYMTLTDFGISALSNTRLSVYYYIDNDGEFYDAGYNIVDVGAGSPVLLRGSSSGNRDAFIHNFNKKGNDNSWLYGVGNYGIVKYSNASNVNDLPVLLLTTPPAYAEPIYYDNALYTIQTSNVKDVYKYNLLNGNLNKLFTLVGNYNYTGYLTTMLVSNK